MFSHVFPIFFYHAGSSASESTCEVEDYEEQYMYVDAEREKQRQQELRAEV